MYSIIIIEANISISQRTEWMKSYFIGFITSQVVTPLLKALLDCLMVVSLTNIDFDSKSARFMKKILGDDFVNWYNI